MRFVDIRNRLGKAFCDYLLTGNENYKKRYLTLRVPPQYKSYTERRIRFYSIFEKAFEEFLPASNMERVLFLGKVLNNLGFYFEAHELVEKYWLKYKGELKKFLQAIVQVAIANMHLESGNIRGYRRIKLLAIENLKPFKGSIYGINVDGLKEELKNNGCFIPLI